MRYIEREHAYILDTKSRFPIIAGFTKPTITGKRPAYDIPKALLFTKKDIAVGYMNQLHGPQVRFIEKPGLYDCDGLFTKTGKIALAVKTADCMPLIFYSKEEDVIGVVHMGWRSAREGILDNIDFNLSSFWCVAGVGLRECCYMVGEEFSSYETLAPFLKRKTLSYYFDPIGFARKKMAEKGLKEQNFFDLKICPHCSGLAFPSNRKIKNPDRTLSFILKF